MELLEEAVKLAKVDIFVKEYRDQTKDSEVLGVMVSKFGKWTDTNIFEVTTAALEDSNFHTLNEKFIKFWEAEN